MTPRLRLVTASQLCNVCGRTLSDHVYNEPETYVVCAPCGVLHVKTPTGLARVAWSDVPPEFAALAKEVIAHHWSQRIAVARAYRPRAA